MRSTGRSTRVWRSQWPKEAKTTRSAPGENDEVRADEQEDVDHGNGPALEARHHDEDPGGRDQHRADEDEAEGGEQLAAQSREVVHGWWFGTIRRRSLQR